LLQLSNNYGKEIEATMIDWVAFVFGLWKISPVPFLFTIVNL
jgi:hypothetical protein